MDRRGGLKIFVSGKLVVNSESNAHMQLTLSMLIYMGTKLGCRLTCSFPLMQVFLYPYSTQATNRANRHELIFLLIGGGGGIREVSLKWFLQSSCSTSQSRFRYDVVTIIRGNGSIRLESRKNSLRLANNIRTCCTKVKESITNQLRICRMQHELGTN